MTIPAEDEVGDWEEDLPQEDPDPEDNEDSSEESGGEGSLGPESWSDWSHPIERMK